MGRHFGSSVLKASKMPECRNDYPTEGEKCKRQERRSGQCGMPGLNGYELVKKLRLEAWGKDMILIASTGWGQDDDRMRAFASGFVAHLTKPFDPESLFRLFSRDQEKADH